MSTLVERLRTHVRYEYMPAEARKAMDEAATTITRLEGERDDALKDNKKLRMMMEAREKLQDAFGVDMHQNATEAALEFAQREIDAVARAEAAEAENARLREALTKIRAVRPEIVTHVPEGFAPVLSCQQIATDALTGDLTNG